jgi:hypothetical protein
MTRRLFSLLPPSRLASNTALLRVDTCDYVDQDTGMYQQVRTALNELTMFDDIVDSGSAQLNLAKVALLYSETADIWYSPLYTPGAAKRSLYLALRHAQIPLDIVNEGENLLPPPALEHRVHSPPCGSF